MKQEFKWILTVELDVDEDEAGTDDKEHLSDLADSAFSYAQDKFFDALNSSDDIAGWGVLDEELK